MSHLFSTAANLDAMVLSLVQTLLKKAGKPSVLGSLDENEPDADDEEEDEEEDTAATEVESNSVDKLTDLLGKTGLTS